MPQMSYSSQNGESQELKKIGTLLSEYLKQNDLIPNFATENRLQVLTMQLSIFKNKRTSHVEILIKLTGS